MRNDRWAPYGAASGVAAVLLFVVGFLIIPQPPDLDALPIERAAYFGDERTQIHVGSAFFLAAAPFFLWFLATISSLTRAGTPGARRAGTVAYGSGVVVIALFLADVTALSVGALRPDAMASVPELGGALLDFSFLALGAAALVTAAIFAAFAVLVLRDRALWPDWLGWLAILASICCALRLGTLFTTEGTFAADGALGFYVPVGALLAWTLLGSVALASSVRATPEAGGLFGPVSGLLGRVRSNLPGGGSG